MNKLFLQPCQKDAIINRLFAEESGDPTVIQQYKTAIAVVERLKFQKSLEIVKRYLPEEHFTRFKRACISVLENGKTV